MPRTYFVYVLASDSRELYVGVTNNLQKRLAQHRDGLDPEGYTARHETKRLVYVEMSHDVLAAITREKQIKGWKRKRKIELIETLNPDWEDLGQGMLA
jgi:putative endonuclease